MIVLDICSYDVRISGMDTTLLKRDETNELDSKTVVVVVKDGSGGEREVKLSGKQRAALEWLMDDWNLTKAAEFAGGVPADGERVGESG